MNNSDMEKVSKAIDGMEDEWMDDGIPEGCAACGNPAYPDCASSCNIYDE